MVDELKMLERLAQAERDPAGFLANIQQTQTSQPQLGGLGRQLTVAAIQRATDAGVALSRDELENLTTLCRSHMGKILHDLVREGLIVAESGTAQSLVGIRHTVRYRWAVT